MIVLKYPHIMLKVVCAPVDNFGKELAALAKRMTKVMKKNGGIGLAGNQVGQPIQIAVFNIKGCPSVIVNPKLVDTGKKTQRGPEGCLSFPGLTLTTERPETITIEYQNLEGKKIVKILTGLAARCVLHEMDHLIGITFRDTDRNNIDNRYIITKDGLKTLAEVLKAQEERKNEENSEPVDAEVTTADKEEDSNSDSES